MTKWLWPKLVNMTKNIINIITTTNMNGWIWPKYRKYYKYHHNYEHEWVNMTEIYKILKISPQQQTWMGEYDQNMTENQKYPIFGQIYPYMFIAVVIFIIFSIFWSNFAIFQSVIFTRSCSSLWSFGQVLRCQFYLVKF